MIPLFVGVGGLGIGLAYTSLGLLSAWEAVSLHRYRGWSRFGLGFSLMAASCGPHHLTHGWHVLQSGNASGPLVAATLIGLPAGLIFVWLRIEAMCGGRGERLIAASAHQAILLAGALAMVAGGLAAWSFFQPGSGVPLEIICTSLGAITLGANAGSDVSYASVKFLANIFVVATYGMVGWYLADRQVRRYLTSDVWSLSGVSLTGVFFTCAQMHLIDATTDGDGLMLVFDLLGVPASVYFLWVVKRLHNDSVMDWNRRPFVGAAGAPARPSPWSNGIARR